MEGLTLCKDCKSYVGCKCQDYFEPGVLYPCVNFIKEQSDEHSRNDNQRRAD
jgi:hypothetical protein